MNDPKRLVLDCTAVEGAMLRSASVDVAPSDLHENLNAALLLGASAGAVSVSVAAAASHAAAAPSVAAVSTTATAVSTTGVSTSVLAGGASVAAMKWVGLALAGTALSLGVHATLSSPAATKKAEPEAHGTLAAERAVAPVAAPTPRLPDRAVAPTPQPVAEPRSVVDAPKPPSPASPLASAPRAVDDMPRELAILDEARSALTAGDATRVIERLDRHDLDFPQPRLAAEALALRIEAYALRHDGERVRGLASTFLAAYPSHPLGARIRTLAREGVP